ncbi:acyl-CoA synthetase [Jannaschia seohaensis]|uniref:Fatty-acyl-CoA synthase/long-chain acyl-CoA synthetase n=1 Tax=Jannaschia seohaensis TaxID=475081 RepID=A0A2Y9BY43_9RHOB|nr:acyl-CoA synthetase [Jannaschia seohaensis]PWJ21366.1 fatty-acyl-CoA synthase/long-chain acyl-CoA synthetase [Jannaschia seohaensis]SSA41972.1 fatty-acyl-CoA synthase/long-chain acyl-CoA synthetase [Jannaschia seohaensis]
MTFRNRQDILDIQAAEPWENVQPAKTVYELLSKTAAKHGDRPAVSYQLFSGPTDPAETLTWSQFKGKVTQAANLFRKLGVQEGDSVAYVLPNAMESATVLMGGAVAGIVNPINPLLDAEQIGSILRETNAKVVVTLRAFPKTDVAQKVAKAVELAPNVQTVLEVDLHRYLTGLKKFIVPLIRPKLEIRHKARVLSWSAEVAKQRADALDFPDATEDRVAAYFHTGGTTGMPKVAQHTYSGMIYNGWIGHRLLFTEKDVVICPLPLFHVFACHVILMAMVASGAHVVFPTPQGYRGEGVFDNFWKLVERWGVTFIITVPTAMSALMQRKVDADVSTVKTAFSGSSPLPVELFKRFEKETGVTVVEGYGLTEATCLVSCNPVEGEKKIGSVGIPFMHTDVKILIGNGDGPRECGIDEVGEICVSSPGVYAGRTYTETEKNKDLYYTVGNRTYLRTGDLGRVDGDGYLWITGRAKDLIIRGGHNIDPAEIEEALAGHPAVAMAGAIGQPDAFAGELPCAYVELVAGASATPEELVKHCESHVHERAARPKHVEILTELPKTAVGKVFKPDLRKRAITRIYDAALADAGVAARVAEVVEDKRRGLVARLEKTGEVEEREVIAVMGNYTRPWEWAE